MRLPAAHRDARLLEVVRIADPGDPFAAGGVRGEVVEVRAEDEVRQTLALVGGLPDGERSRCFLPGWAVRLYDEADPEPLFEIAFCFRCDGARLLGREVPAELGFQDFDGQSPAGQELLRWFRACERD
ncbi:hypothetical protein [Streptomyces sp. LUP30]|uniref:hypothetical protein n=1 Tax=Streptomyces sp. LUP30 TaxID=1890285 RepID=UPI000851D2DC|nr:hypothetical protein [Streptomyces sp. LUP30]